MKPADTTSRKQNELFLKMQRLGIREEDIQENFIRSSGPGGQNVNKVATCVCLYHRPTGVSVKCQIARTQGQNRFLARVLLAQQIEKKRQEQIQKDIHHKEKLRRQRRKRSKWAKEKMLEDKRFRSEKKKNRQLVKVSNLNKY